MKNKALKIFLGLALLFLGGLTLSGCSTSQLVDVWKAPQFDFNSINKVVVIAAIDGQNKRRIWEDSFVNVLHDYGIEATPSYKLFPKDIPNEDEIHSTFNNKYDGVVLVQKLNSKIVKRFVPGDYYMRPVGWMYNPFFRHYRWIYSGYHTPGYFTRDKIVRFQASLYQTNDEGTLIWDATSEVETPHSQKQLSRELSDLIVPNMMNKKEHNS